MPKDYKIEVVTPTRNNRIKVRVLSDSSEHWVNTFADLVESDMLADMGKWCEENECGYRTSYNEFKFRNREQLTMFILRWA